MKTEQKRKITDSTKSEKLRPNRMKLGTTNERNLQ